MIAKAIHFLAALSPLRWAGPVYLKELLCASRRWRFYLLRVGYIAALTLFVASVYVSQERSVAMLGGGSNGEMVPMASRMADIGKHVISNIAWFQYIAAQLVAVLLMSNAITAEIQKQTLPALLTTPITYFQISFGKILGGIQQVILLLLIGLPLLALVRVLGGVPWEFVLGTSIVTIGAAILAAALTFNFSILFRQPYAVLMMSLLALGLWHGLAWILWPFMLGWALDRVIQARRKRSLGVAPTVGRAILAARAARSGWGVVSRYGFAVACYVAWWVAADQVPGMGELPAMAFSPSVVTYALGEDLLNPGRMRADWWCVALSFLVTAGSGVYFLCRGAGLLRGIVHSKLWGDLLPAGAAIDPWSSAAALNRMSDAPRPEPVKEIAGIVALAVPVPAEDPLYGRVERFGSPVAWKDLRGSLIRNDLVRFFAVFLPVGLACVMYFGMLISESFLWIRTHAAILAGCVGLGALFTAILSGMAITSERQARTWPILQTTALSGGQILYGKAVAVLFRAAPIWLLLFAHLLIFTVIGQIHPWAFLLVVGIVVWVNAFLIGSGFLISTFTRQATLAAGMNVAVAVILWLLLPAISGLVAFGDKPLNGYHAQFISPVQQTVATVICLPGNFSRDKDEGLPRHASGGPRRRGMFDLYGWGDLAVVSLSSLAVYGGAGMFLGAWAIRRFRRHAF